MGRSERHKAAICMHAVAEGTEALVAPGVGANPGWSLKDIDIVVGMRGAEALLEACAKVIERGFFVKLKVNESFRILEDSEVRATQRWRFIREAAGGNDVATSIGASICDEDAKSIIREPGFK